ncbi:MULTISPECIES: PspC domain-containing protein [unclassified Streptomyces]|uniref:PspC domain-containing protein n=1 Tax=unclassified Streptomyces TaxID=2593676 RepID=UPI00081B71B1|nr:MULTISPECIES: PspC domain-containing protein [unclassified Streptomyces]MYQ84096.1 PspC domain-containing protein [Streptomyces sp. SID4936]SCD79559.1 phage shock protein C (PspC) family protein [Streptomyces sp. DvalAA-43]
MTVPQDASPGVAPPPDPAPLLRRSRQHKVVAGVCGGLGRYCDVDPVIFRIVLGVLSVTGGIGLIFYGFAWLLVPVDGEEENEARRLLSGRVEGASLIAVLLALIGCGLFLSMLGNGGTLAFSAMLSLAVVGFAVWTQHRRTAAPEDPLHPATAQAVADAPPEVKAPPSPGSPSWWRDPIVKDGTTGPVAAGYLWGPADAAPVAHAARPTADAPFRPPLRESGTRGPASIGGVVFLFALIAGGLGTGLSWDSQPFGTSLQFGLAGALAVFGLGMLVSSFLGRTGFGTVMLAMITAALLAGASALPKNITTQWVREGWRPASVAAVQPHYQLGTGVARLDLTGITVPRGATVATGVNVGAGRAVVVVPEDVTVKVDARATIGDITLPVSRPGEAAQAGKAREVDVNPAQRERRTLPPPPGSRPAGTVELTLEVGIGQVEVTRAAS